MSGGFTDLPPDLPVPENDGAADHLVGSPLPSLSFPSSLGGTVNLAAAAAEAERYLVAYVYPRTGTPGQPLPTGWDDIPGARGCTPQSCSYRDALADFATLGASVVGISTQTPEEQREFAEREHIPYPLLSDPELQLHNAMDLPTFEVDDMALYKRLTLIANRDEIVKTFYPVFPPDHNAAEILAWLRTRAAQGTRSES